MKEKVLVIESDPYERGILYKVFSSKYKLTFTASVEDAIEISKKSPQKVMLYNMESPDAQALQNLKKLKEEDELQTPIITIISENTLEVENAVRGIGVFYYLIKPYNFRDLEESILGAVLVWDRKYGNHNTNVMPDKNQLNANPK